MFDTIFLVIIIFLLVLGLLKGFLKELFPAAGLFLGYLAAGKLHVSHMNIIGQYVRNAAEAKVITYIIIFLMGFIIGIILDSIIFMILKRGKTSASGRIMGGLLGVFKGIIVSLVVFYIVRGYIPAFSDELETSHVAPYLQIIWKFFHNMGFA